MTKQEIKELIDELTDAARLLGEITEEQERAIESLLAAVLGERTPKSIISAAVAIAVLVKKPAKTGEGTPAVRRRLDKIEETLARHDAALFPVR